MGLTKQLRENFTLIGEAMINKDLSKYVSTEPLGKNGWMRKRLNLGVKISNSNKIYCELEGGFWSKETIEKTKNETGKDEKGKPKRKQNWIYNGETVEGKWIADNIPFEKRFEKESIDKIPYYNRLKVSLQPEKLEDGTITYKEKEFIFAGDAIDEIKKHLKNGQRIYIYGHVEINQYIGKQDNKLKTRFNRIIDQIRIADDDEKNEASGTTNFLFEKDGFDDEDFKKEKKIYIQGYRTYKNDDKKIIPVPVNYILDFSSENVNWEDDLIKERVEYLINVFKTAKKDKVYSTKWRYLAFEGKEQADLTEKDLSKDVRMRIKLKFITLEKALEQARNKAIGDKIKEIKLVMPLGEENKVLMEDLTTDDLIPPKIENKIDKIDKKEESKTLDKEKNKTLDSFDSMFQ